MTVKGKTVPFAFLRVIRAFALIKIITGGRFNESKRSRVELLRTG